MSCYRTFSFAGGVGLEPKKSQSQMWFSAHRPEGFRDIGAAKIAKETDDEVPEGGHNPWRITLSYL